MSLQDQLAQLANPTPLFKDPEDDVDLDTAAKLVDFQKENNVDGDVDEPKSTLRLQNAALLADTDSRYAGKRTSRRQLQKDAFRHSYTKAQIGEGAEEESDNESSESGESDERGSEMVSEGNEDSEEDDDDEDTLKEFKAQLDKSASNKLMNTDEGSESEMDDEDEIENDFEDDDDDEEEIKNEVEGEDEDEDHSNDEDEDDSNDDEKFDKHLESSEEEDSLMNVDKEDKMEQHSDELGTIQTFSKMHLNEEADKGAAVKSQLRLWDALLECRIKLQKVLLAANQLPQHDVWPLFCEQGGSDYEKEGRSSQQSIKFLLDSLIELQTLLLSKNVKTKKPGKTSNAKEESDEEIPSDTEDEANSESEVEEINLKRKLKVTEYPEFLKKRRIDLEHFRNNTIQEWNDKTKVSSGKINKSFTNFELPILKQIEQILQDEHRLVQRTQLKRSSYELLGKQFTLDIENGQGQTVSGQEAVLKQDFHLKDYDVEIFDDNDFYHQLLRELIERKTADVRDPIVLGRQWLEIQRMRSKMKRKTDTKASKGRKIRYDVHPKLVNFMAPVDHCTMMDDSRKDLFNSLFGRKWQDSENKTSV